MSIPPAAFIAAPKAPKTMRALKLIHVRVILHQLEYSSQIVHLQNLCRLLTNIRKR